VHGRFHNGELDRLKQWANVKLCHPAGKLMTNTADASVYDKQIMSQSKKFEYDSYESLEDDPCSRLPAVLQNKNIVI